MRFRQLGEQLLKLDLLTALFFTILTEAPSMMLKQAHAINKTCHFAFISHTAAHAYSGLAILWEIIFWIVPSVLILLIYSSIVHTLRNTGRRETESIRQGGLILQFNFIVLWQLFTSN